MIGSSTLRRVFWLRRVLPLLLVGLLFVPTVLLGGCGGDKKQEDPSLRYDRQIVLVFKPEATQEERTAVFQKYGVLVLRPYGSLPDAFVLFLPDEFDMVTVREAMKKEPTVKFAANGQTGPF